MNAKGKLYLIPVPISEFQASEQILSFNAEIIRKLRHFVAEDAKTARRFLKLSAYNRIEDARIHLLNEHSKTEDHSELIKPLLMGEDVGLMSDAGCPGIADPGAEIVKLAHQKNVQVIPLIGPSSIVLSIMASGFNGQNFAFNGYLPVEKAQRQKKIKELEQLARTRKQAQFFIETPYRNQQMFESLIGTLNSDTLLFLGRSLLDKDQWLKSAAISEWKKLNLPEIHKMPVVFGIYV